jgi:tetratricopeptide (TPR) repeat protein
MLPLSAPTALIQAPHAAQPLGTLLEQARAARAAGRLNEALRAYEAMLAQVSTHETALLERAETLGWAGRYEEAAAGLRAFRSAHPGRAVDADLFRARFAAWQNRTAEALAILDPWVQQGHRQAVLDAATYLSWGGRIPECLRRLGLWLEGHPDDHEARLLQAKVLGWDGQHAAARATYGQVLSKRPADREALAGLARLSLWEGDPQAARATLARMEAEGRSHAETGLLLAQVDLAEGSARSARSRARALLGAPGANPKEARELLEDLADAKGPWVELSAARTDTSEGLRLEDPLLRGRVPLGDGALDLSAARHRVAFQGAERATGELGLALSHPLGPRWWASAALSRLSEVGGEPAWGHGLGLGFAPAVGVDLRIDQSHSQALFTPAAVDRRTSFSATDLSAAWRFGQGRHALNASAGRAELSAGSHRNSWMAAYEYRLPVTGLDLRAGLLARAFGYSPTLALGFFNPASYRWQGLTGSATWRRGRVFEAAVLLRAGRQQVNDGDATFTWAGSAMLIWTPRPGPFALTAAWSHTEAGLPVAGPADPAGYREHTLRLGLRVRGTHWIW